MKSHFFAVTLIILALLAGFTSTALASNEGPGTSTGSGRVFLPNPVASLGDQSLTDQKDADYPALQPAYHVVTLTNLDGSGYLRGDWANIRGETGNPAFSSTNDFIYGRNDDRFEQVMAYYWVTEAQKYIQSLGFGSTLRPVSCGVVMAGRDLDVTIGLDGRSVVENRFDQVPRPRTCVRD